MNILFVTYHTCARASKEARALEAAGHQVIVLQFVASSEEILYATNLSSFYRTENDLIHGIDRFSDWCDVIHCHNEPNWIVIASAAARDRFCPTIPLVFDIHDLDSQRDDGSIDAHEGNAIHAADAFIFPSKAYREGVYKTWNVTATPGLVVYSFCNKADIVETALPRVNGIVYEGGVVAPIEDIDTKSKGYKTYREYVSLAKKLAAAGVAFHLYGVQPKFKLDYLAIGAIPHEMMPYSYMLRQLSRYDWGLCGHIDNHPQWQKAMPNKLFEYLAAGIPVISINAGEVSEFVCRNSIGVEATSIESLVSAMRDTKLRASCAEFVQANRHQFVMENQVPGIEGLYAEAAIRRQSRLEARLSMRAGKAGGEATGKWVCVDNPNSAA